MSQSFISDVRITQLQRVEGQLLLKMNQSCINDVDTLIQLQRVEGQLLKMRQPCISYALTLTQVASGDTAADDAPTLHQ